MSFDVRVRRYEVAGSAAEVVRTLDLTATLPYGDTGMLRCSIPAALFGALPTVAELALEYWDDDEGEWIEPLDGRFLTREAGMDEREPSDTRTITAVPLWDWLLRKNYVAAGDVALVDGHRPFNSATPGAIIKTLIDEAQVRGWAPFLDYDFTAALDSNGQPWDGQLTIAYQPGRTTVLTVLQNLLDQGACERATEGRTLHLYNPGSGTDWTAGAYEDAPVRVGLAATQMPVTRNVDDLVTDLTFYGDDGFTLEIANVGAYSGLGRLETTIVQGGVSDAGTATLLGQQSLTKGAEARESVQATEQANRALALPWKHYQVGDWVLGRRRADWERLRVQELVVTKNIGNVVTVSPTLNDRFLDLLARMARRQNGILGGAVAGGTGVTPADRDRRKPKPPVGLVVESTGYWSKGAPLSAISAVWSAVVEGENDVAIDVTDYELLGRRVDMAEAVVLTSSTAPEASWSPFTPGEDWYLSVRARSRDGVWGDPCAEEIVTTVFPVEDLEQPTAPDVESTSGVVLVTWNGYFNTDPITGPPAHFMQMNVEISPSEAADFVVTSVLWVGQESTVLGGLGVGSEWWIRLVPVDALGRVGTPSAAVLVTVSGIDGDDVIVGTLHGNKIIAGTIEASQLVAGIGGQLDISANDSITLIVGQLGTVQDNVDGVVDNLADLRLRYDFDVDGLHIRQPGSPVELLLDNEALEIRESGQATLRAESGRITVSDVVLNRLIFTTHVVEETPNGLVFRSAES